MAAHPINSSLEYKKRNESKDTFIFVLNCWFYFVVVVFQDKRICFYKRAQILVADFWGMMEARGERSITNIDWLTMFADYRVPQALVYLGVLRYSDSLLQALKNGGTDGSESFVFLTEKKKKF